MRGNLPQAFVHALLLQCAVTEPARDVMVPACSSSLRALYGGGLLLAPGADAVRGWPGCRWTAPPWSSPGCWAPVRSPRRHSDASDHAGALLLGAGVDLAHAASMATLSRRSPHPGHRVLARRNARTAAVLSAAGAAAAMRPRAGRARSFPSTVR